MDEQTLGFLLSTAVTIGFVHTIIGADHSLPFIALSRARNWSFPKTIGLTALCGLAHVASSVVLGFVGIGLGVAISELSWVEAMRGELAAYLIIGFGLAYGSWAIVRRQRGRSHSHLHSHVDGTVHDHQHDHSSDHVHPHPDSAAPGAVTSWSLFLIFVFGPCEALIPMLMAPAAENNWTWVVLVVAAFGATTVATMLGVVSVAYFGLRRARFRLLESWGDAVAGFSIASTGIAIKMLGI